MLYLIIKQYYNELAFKSCLDNQKTDSKVLLTVAQLKIFGKVFFKASDKIILA